MTDVVPSWIEEQLEFDSTKDVQDIHIMRAFLDSDRPYLSRRQVEREIGLSSQGTRDRLLDLEERGILRSEAAGGGRIYWLNRDASDWPVPPDVDVEPVSNAATVEELLEKQPVQFAGVGLLLMIAGALLTTLFTLALAYEVTFPFVGAQQLLRWAIIAVFVGIACCIGGGAIWFTDRIRILTGSQQ